MKNFVLTPTIVQNVLATVDAGLTSGLGVKKPGHMCVEAAVCYALDLPHSDDPQCVDPIIRSLKITLNDSNWSSKKTRADGLRKLAVLQLGTKGNFDQKTFAKKLALMVVTTILPISLNAIGLIDHAKRCAAATTLEEAKAASDAASDAARAASDAARAASYAARAASYAARYAASDAARAASDAARAARAASYAARAARAASYAARAASDNVLKVYATGVENILVEMAVPAVKYLKLINA